MTSDAAPTREFHLGLTMSGAISAGAYTAGVFDFLIQALDEWERAKRGGIPGLDPAALPDHFLGIKVISGASAGAITGAIGAVALADEGRTPRLFPNGGIQCWLPKLYEAWVEKVQLCADAAGEVDFLSTGDLDGAWPKPDEDYFASSKIRQEQDKKGPPAMSLLNSRLLDAIAHDALKVAAVRAPRAYLSENLHLYFTLTNLRGVPYRLAFTGGDYHMLSHGDRAHFIVTGLGGWRTQSVFCDGDLGAGLAAAWLAPPPPPAPPASDAQIAAAVADAAAKRDAWKDFTICALASAAFPVGLSARHVFATTADYGVDAQGRFRRYPDEALADTPIIEPNWAAKGDFPFMTADGGTIDNDPFEYARFGVKADLKPRNDPDPASADRAVIMISPFAEPKPPLAQGMPAPDIVSVFRRLMPSLIDQARFKPGELALALKPDHASRYLIAPSRIEIARDAAGDRMLDETGREKELDARYAIASGLLGGFGGFVAREFRDHDFQLGRRNCQRFLQTYFALPGVNPLIAASSDAAKTAFRALALPQTEAAPHAATKAARVCLIPLVGSAQEEVAAPQWPRISQDAFDRLRPRIARRYDKTTAALIEANITNFVQYWAFRLLATSFPLIGAKRLALDFVDAAILSDLIRRDQIEGFADVPCLVETKDGATRVVLDRDRMRAILAAIVHPSNQPRSASMVLNDLKGDPAFVYQSVKDALDRLTQPDCAGRRYAIMRAPWRAWEEELYALAARPPRLGIVNAYRTVRQKILDGLAARFPGARARREESGAAP